MTKKKTDTAHITKILTETPGMSKKAYIKKYPNKKFNSSTFYYVKNKINGKPNKADKKNLGQKKRSGKELFTITEALAINDQATKYGMSAEVYLDLIANAKSEGLV